MLAEPLTPSALLLAAASFAVDRLIAYLRRRKRSKWRRLEKAIAIGVNAAWHSYVRDLKRPENHPTPHLHKYERDEAQRIALATAEAHAKQTCPKLWRKLSDAEKCYLIDQALRQRKVQNQNPRPKNPQNPS